MQSYQDLVHEVIDIIDHEIGVVDPDGTVLACSDTGKIGSSLPDTFIDHILKNTEDCFIIDQHTFFRQCIPLLSILPFAS